MSTARESSGEQAPEGGMAADQEAPEQVDGEAADASHQPPETTGPQETAAPEDQEDAPEPTPGQEQAGEGEGGGGADPSVQLVGDGEEVVMIDGIPVLADIEEKKSEDGSEESEEIKKEIIEQIKDALEERKKMQSLNLQVQHEIAEYLARKKV